MKEIPRQLKANSKMNNDNSINYSNTVTVAIDIPDEGTRTSSKWKKPLILIGNICQVLALFVALCVILLLSIQIAQRVDSPKIKVFVDGIKCEMKALVDTGSMENIINYDYVSHLPIRKVVSYSSIQGNGDTFEIYGKIKLNVSWAGEKKVAHFIVVKNLRPQIILGIEWIAESRANIYYNSAKGIMFVTKGFPYPESTNINPYFLRKPRMKLQMSGVTEEIEALIDTGSNENFLKYNNVSHLEPEMTWTLQLVGLVTSRQWVFKKIRREIKWKDTTSQEVFFVMRGPGNVILGVPWIMESRLCIFYDHNSKSMVASKKCNAEQDPPYERLSTLFPRVHLFR